jgi:hypothetical protein
MTYLRSTNVLSRLKGLLGIFVVFVMVGLLFSAIGQPAQTGQAVFGGYKIAWHWITDFGHGSGAKTPTVKVK